MSNPYAAIATLLEADSAVAALVGTRIYPGFANLDAPLPQVCAVATGGESVMSHGGASGLGFVTLQITCWGATYSAACTAMEAARLCLEGYSGAAGGFTDFRVVRVSGLRDVPDASAGNDALKRFGVSRDFTIHHDEAKPS